MEAISVTTSELVSEFTEAGLAIPTILRQILLQFSNSELLTLSLVNKQWSFEARSVFKGRGNLTARLSTCCSCQSLAAFASDLEKMRVVPFSGIHVVISHPIGLQPPSYSSLGSSCTAILDGLPCKHLSVSLIDTCWEDCKNCQALVLVHRILEVNCGTLEKLSLTLDSDRYGGMLQRAFRQHWNFPHLITFKIQADRPVDGSITNFAKALVSRAPNLQELHFDGAIIFEEDVLKGSSALLVPDFEFHPLSQQVCESMMSSVKAEKIAILVDFEDFDPDLLSRVIPVMLQNSHATLKDLTMDLLFALPLMCYGICFENVTKLEICMRSDSLRGIQLPILSFYEKFDFTRIFPKLQNVKIQELVSSAFSAHHISGFVEQGNAVMRKALPDRAVNIKHLTLLQSYWGSNPPFWAQMFPNIVKLEMNIGSISPFPFTILWERFVKLEELHVTSVHWDLSMIVNLDSVFCGIFPEEVAELEEKDDEYLKAVNIVPVMPSIGCMRDLRTLTLDHTLPSYILGDRKDPKPNQKYMFSKVTALVGFARCPALAVTFATNSYTAKALSHMEPYVSFIITASLLYIGI